MSARADSVLNILGVDFSGSSDAGRKIWLTRGRLDRDGALRVVSCGHAAELPGGAAARDVALAALRAEILAEPSVCGLDFPVGIPRSLLNGCDWRSFLDGFEQRFADAESFRRGCTAAADGRELRRATDRAARTPFSPYNLRLYRQTYYGIRDVIRPLVCERRAIALPMQLDELQAVGGAAALGRVPVLLEICPASLLKRLGRYVAYKGRGDEHRRQRGKLLDAVVGEASTELAEASLRDIFLDDPEGDALDSLLAALATARAARDGTLLKPADDPDGMLEGWVYC